MRIANLMASPFFGGPERQMLGLARHLPAGFESVFLSFAENGRCRPFLDEAQCHGFETRALVHNAPNFRLAAAEVAKNLRRLGADVLTCSGYKPDLLGWRAARQAGIPVVSVSHGWTAATLKVRLYESLDRLVLRWMDAVVCVSEAQASRVRAARVPENKIVVIRNAIPSEAFAPADPAYGTLLRSFFVRPPRHIVGAAGRLSPEKGFDQLVEAAARVLHRAPDVGFIHFGDGPLRENMEQRIASLGLRDRFVLAGFRSDIAGFLPHLDLVALPSYTEGLPVVLLEAFAAGVPAVATAVGGTPEVVQEGKSGYLIPARDPVALAERILQALGDDAARRQMGSHARRHVQEHFTFAAQSLLYQELFEKLVRGKCPTCQMQPAS